MLRRWVIRVFFMVPIVLCAVGWVWGAMLSGAVCYAHSERFVYVAPTEGRILVALGVDPIEHDGWRSSFEYLSRAYFWPPIDNDYYHYHLGFTFGPREKVSGNWRAFAVPYWFLILLSSGVFWWVWRKTRAVTARGAFPVEVRGTTDERSGK